jgi:hypothetical protein
MVVVELIVLPATTVVTIEDVMMRVVVVDTVFSDVLVTVSGVTVNAKKDMQSAVPFLPLRSLTKA